MRGYLRSLAAQGTTPGPRLRPIDAPFARGPLPSDRPDPLEVDAETTAPPVVPPLPETRPGHAPTERVGQDETVQRPPMTLAEAIVRLTDPPMRARESQPFAPVAPKPRLDSRPAPEPRPTPSIPVVATPLADTTPETPRPGRHRSATSDSDRGVKPRVVTAPAIPRMGRARVSEQRSEPAQNRQESTPDVHIHIGRIELTAVTPPVAPRRQPSAVKAAMPLDEYLQRRNGRDR